ncbi:MAG TPA: tRNA pseudouridine synthase A, partial [Candidatus Baltobacteraceae bacterium]|nr:tRNA pseudouridine synthase A [Candidatus Baltobacteraceae bacterium]
KLLGHEVKLTSAGRTDAGVHASGQVVSFKSGAAFPFDRLAIAANAELSRDVSVREAHVCETAFSARFSAIERAYVYAIYLGQQRSALFHRFAYHVWRDVDVEKFAAGARHIIGEHDFRSFCGMLPQSGPTTRTVRFLEVQRFGDLLRVEIRADGFLHRMVRTIVGTLTECAVGKRDPDSIPEIIAARDRAAAGLTAPAQGLYLAGVRYEDGFDSFAEPPLFRSGCLVKS